MRRSCETRWSLPETRQPYRSSWNAPRQCRRWATIRVICIFISPATSEADDQTILDLLEAEDIQFGSILAYNEPAGPYTGLMETMASPQLRGLGESSLHNRGPIWIASGQEYRSGTYGHLNLYWQTDLVLKGQKTNAGNWPLYGELSRDTMRMGGFAIYAHGGYSQAIHADFVQKRVSAVELLQFGVYRGIELAGWYDILNIGYRFPCVGASDYPACRMLGDCRTYVSQNDQAGFAGWLKAAAEGRSFVTTGPLLLLEVDGERPGGIIRIERTRAASNAGAVAGQEPCRTGTDRPDYRRGEGCVCAGGGAGRSNGAMDRARSNDRSGSLIMDRRAGFGRDSDRCSRRRGAHEPGLRRHRREGPVQP